MSSDSEENVEMCESPEISDLEFNTSSNTIFDTSLNSKSLPRKTQKVYTRAYQDFMDWHTENDVKKISEPVLLNYFQILSEKYKSSSLWCMYSMLRSKLAENNNIHIDGYTNLRAFLKQKSQGYQGKRAKTFTSDEIKKFLSEAPDYNYLNTKVVLIMGLMGARTNEMHTMKITDIEDFGTMLLVTIPAANKKVGRKFSITGQYYEICKNYMNLRPPDVESPCFFLNMQKGKCTSQSIGLNRLGAMGKDIANYLKLPNPELYTGHSFRKSSGSLLENLGAPIGYTNGGNSTAISDSYIIDDTVKNKVINFFNHSNDKSGEESTSTHSKPNEVNFDLNGKTSICISNCTNVTINFISSNKPPDL